MKILLLNHYIDAQHKISLQLQASGAVVLFAGSREEAWKMIQFHGPSLDLAVIHREGATPDTDDGVQLITRIKADQAQADLPIILTSSEWNEADFFRHQQSPEGVNAYLRWPFTDDELTHLIEKMFGNSIRFAGATLSGVSSAPKSPSANPPLPSFSGISVVLEERSESSRQIDGKSDSGLKLEAPVLNEPPPTPPSSKNDNGFQLEVPGAPAQEIKLELSGAQSTQGASDQDAPLSPPPFPSKDGEGLSLAPPGLPSDAGGLELAPPSQVEEDRTLAINTQGSGQAPLTEDGSLDLSALMNEDLEPHERLEIERERKARAEAQVRLQNEASGASEDEPGTQVLDTDAIALAMESPGEAEKRKSPPQFRGGTLAEEADPAADEELVTELPYLFSKKNNAAPGETAEAGLVFAEPVGDAVVPGGASQSPDVETLKKYLLLREQDVAVLSNQLKSAREQITSLDKQLREQKGHAAELNHVVSEQRRRIDEFEREKALALQGLQSEIEELRFQHRTKSDKAKVLEKQVREATDEIERLKERVRTDIRKIRVRERELENKLEIVRKDSEALITARESKIMELKRKIDLLEFNMDLLQDQYTREKENSASLRERLGRAAQVVRVAGGLLDTPDQAEPGVSQEDSQTPIDKKTSREAS